MPLFLEDGKTAAIYIQVRAQGDQEILFAVSDRLRDLAADSPPGMTVQLTGQAGFFDDRAEIFDSIDGNLLIGTVLLISMLLLLIYRSPFLWLLPLTRSASPRSPRAVSVRFWPSAARRSRRSRQL